MVSVPSHSRRILFNSLYIKKTKVNQNLSKTSRGQVFHRNTRNLAFISFYSYIYCTKVYLSVCMFSENNRDFRAGALGLLPISQLLLCLFVLKKNPAGQETLQSQCKMFSDVFRIRNLTNHLYFLIDHGEASKKSASSGEMPATPLSGSITLPPSLNSSRLTSPRPSLVGGKGRKRALSHSPLSEFLDIQSLTRSSEGSLHFTPLLHNPNSRSSSAASGSYGHLSAGLTC